MIIMRITKIKTSETRLNPAITQAPNEYALYLFRNPVIFKCGGTEKYFAAGASVLYDDTHMGSFRSPDGSALKYDIIIFRTSSADRQYISGLDITLNSPSELTDDYMTASAVRTLEMQLLNGGKRIQELSELYMRIILISIERAGEISEPEENVVPRYDKLKKIRQEIYDEPAKNWSIDDLCRRLAVSRTYFHRIYLSAFGVTFRQDTIESRLAYACKLLLETELTVSAIAEKCGYESESYFMRQFKKHKGTTPSNFRWR